MPNLYPTFEMPELVEEQQAEPEPEYGESWLFDFARGDFVVDGTGRVVIADGHTAWAQWCMMAVTTQRFAYPVYGNDYGAELDEAVRQKDRGAVEADVEQTVTETLLIDPRTKLVRDFAFRWEGDQLFVSFVAEPVIGDAERLEVMVHGS
jgi:hypothetical protein